VNGAPQLSQRWLPTFCGSPHCGQYIPNPLLQPWCLPEDYISRARLERLNVADQVNDLTIISFRGAIGIE
jgi:hypothetical protein